MVNLKFKNDIRYIKAMENIIFLLEEDIIQLTNYLVSNESEIAEYDILIQNYAKPLIAEVNGLKKDLNKICLDPNKFDYINFYYYLKTKSNLLIERLNNLKRYFYMNNKNIGNKSQHLMILCTKLIKTFDLPTVLRKEVVDIDVKIEKAISSNKLSDWGDALNLDTLTEYHVLKSWENFILESIDKMHESRYNNVDKAIGKINFYISNALKIELDVIFTNILLNNYDRTIFMNKNIPQIIDNTLKILYPHIKQLFNENY